MRDEEHPEALIDVYWSFPHPSALRPHPLLTAACGRQIWPIETFSSLRRLP
jgi:hypothetical protein